MTARFRIPQPLAASCRARPQHVLCVADGVGEVSAAAMLEQVARRASILARQGVQRSGTVALAGAPSWDWLCSLHAIGWLGAAVAPLPVKASIAQLRERLRLCTPQHLIVAADAAAAVVAAVSEAARAVGVDCVDCVDSVDCVDGEGNNASSADAATQPPLAERFWPLDETRFVLLTSGTTGAPQVVRLTTAQLVFGAMGSMIRLGHDPADRWLACLPMHHVGGLAVVWRCAFYGTTAIVHDGFDARRVAALLDRGEATLVSLVPAMLQQVLDVRGHERPFPPALRAVLLGGAPAGEALLRRCDRLGVPVCLSWGMTEAASQIATSAPSVGGTFTAASGAPPLHFARVSVAGVVGEPDGVGALVVEGPIVAGGRLRTRDLGYVDAAGRVHVTGRVDDLIISGGENIAPAEIERVLLRHPSVADAAVVAVDDARWGQRPRACLVARGGREHGAKAPDKPGDDELAAWCRAHLEPFKVPDTFVWVDALPRDALGKLRRQQLVAAFRLPVPVRLV